MNKMTLINRFCCFCDEYLFQNMKQKLLLITEDG